MFTRISSQGLYFLLGGSDWAEGGGWTGLLMIYWGSDNPDFKKCPDSRLLFSYINFTLGSKSGATFLWLRGLGWEGLVVPMLVTVAKSASTGSRDYGLE